MKKLLFSTLLLIFLLAGSLSSAQQKTAASPTSAGREPMLVTVDWLADHLNDPSLVLLQIGDKKDYDKGHIPGAQFLEYETISTPHNHGVTLMLELRPSSNSSPYSSASAFPIAPTLFCISEPIG